MRGGKRSGVEFHHPEIVAARTVRVDLNDDLGAAVAIDVADADRSTGVRQAGAVEIRLQRVSRNRRQVERKSGGEGKSVDLGGRGIIKKRKERNGMIGAAR